MNEQTIQVIATPVEGETLGQTISNTFAALDGPGVPGESCAGCGRKAVKLVPETKLALLLCAYCAYLTTKAYLSELGMFESFLRDYEKKQSETPRNE